MRHDRTTRCATPRSGDLWWAGLELAFAVLAVALDQPVPALGVTGTVVPYPGDLGP